MPIRHENETLTEFILRWLEYREAMEPESEYDRRTR